MREAIMALLLRESAQKASQMSESAAFVARAAADELERAHAENTELRARVAEFEHWAGLINEHGEELLCVSPHESGITDYDSLVQACRMAAGETDDED